ncbi:phosphatase PAP2 family protein [Paraburkholderia sp. DHOC27]|uniref:phosphatase PAP2 family protein n=1 Tax=Paraburkholderia sp. DHOC27 TaxID=2303330 RepID=UPI000E3EA1B7|nr:phosphatase PAP2 family protein [Paraburkholderia sp. DHOC27]RFU48977.1 phosphatase PAP2 family protein [Paraburkholderia sp. DHOC27]
MWTAISNIGDAALTLPIAAVCAVWLALSDWRLALRWLLVLAVGMALVGATKILYFGCGVQIPAIGFRMISGHTTLSTSIWTVAFALLFRCEGGSARVGAALGLAIGVLTAVARVFDTAHSVSEVIAGWMLGAAIATWFVHMFVRSGIKPSFPYMVPVSLFFVASVAYGHHAPFQEMIETYSHGVCARLSARLFSALLFR